MIVQRRQRFMSGSRAECLQRTASYKKPYRIAIVLIPENLSWVLLLLGGVVLGWQQECEALSRVWHKPAKAGALSSTSLNTCRCMDAGDITCCLEDVFAGLTLKCLLPCCQRPACAGSIQYFSGVACLIFLSRFIGQRIDCRKAFAPTTNLPWQHLRRQLTRPWGRTAGQLLR